ncbi:FixH family protein [Alteromonas sp. ASW11-36]|uniref:FixH family protein n=1 Tax=Alteromonas arenosi TaxID=3055817 RepID=A0ABT7SXA8_9ALTE|nr:FixH family protein [Alteromonas sp. ASW11-36]MDM7860832.1 FixH family protein [Alteromonas sp. ASW11-36]
MQRTKVTPWYKQFWPWFLISVPLSSFIVGFFVLHLATNTTDSLVVDDYYKEGRAINARLDKIQQAKEMRIVTGLTITENGTVSLRFISGLPRDNTALKLSLYHVTLHERDVEVLLTADATGVFRGVINEDLTGKWRITLLPMDESWKIQQVVGLPQQTEIRFAP